MFKNRSLAFKYSFYLLVCIIVVGGIIGWRNHQVTKKLILANIEENARNLCEATAYKIDQPFVVAAAQAREMAGVLENTAPTRDELKQLLLYYLAESPSYIYGAAIAFEPFHFDPKQKFFSPYVYRRQDRDPVFTFLGNDNYNYFIMDWYHIPKELQRPVWSEPYHDEGGGNVLMTTYSCPFYRKQNGRRVFEGVVTNDISLARLQRLVSEVKLYNTGYSFLISRFGRIITHPDTEKIMNQTIFSLAEESNKPFLTALGRRMIAGESGFVPFHSEILGRHCWLYFMPLKSNGWSLAVVIPEDELLAGLHRLNRTVIFMWLLGLVVLLAVIILITCRVTHPLKVLTAATGEIGKGNFTLPLPPPGGHDEIGNLNRAFGRMQQALNEHIENLRRTTAEKEKIESELKIAREIQLSIIPKFFPPFPNRTEFNIFAVLESAKAVGGDLYDFFFIDDDRLCFAIGDVS
ncbi:MAG: cache domain-containing protein, partial [Victivallales bacterium]|nr:cache domain-containing protein [Victivallales bacterium]